MARRRSQGKRHKPSVNGSTQATKTNNGSQTPKSMVIRIGAGEVGPSVSQLVKDVRSVMEPETAGRLKERRSNRLRDYTAMAGPLGVTHLLLFSRSSSGNTNLRLALTPRGPTLHFRVEKYSLAKDVRKAQKRPYVGGKEHLTPPLLVMNNFLNPAPADGSDPLVPKNLESLTTTVFQSLFPAISPQKTPLDSIRRVLLLNRELPKDEVEEHEGPFVLHLRHYKISTKRTGIPRSIRRLNAAEKLLKQSDAKRNSVPNLGKLDDVADFLLDPSAAASGFTSGSETEADSDAGIEVLQTRQRKVLSQKQINARRAKGAKLADPTPAAVEKRSVRLIEIGPRMKLRMTKVEEGLCNGKIMWHEYLHKTKEEIENMERKWENRRKDKDERRQIQRDNVERKRAEREANNPDVQEDGSATNATGKHIVQEDFDDIWDSEDLDDDGNFVVNSGKENQVAVG